MLIADSIATRNPSPVTQNRPKPSPSITVFHSSQELFVMLYCVSFLPNMSLWIMAKHLHFGLFCLDDIFPKDLWLVQLCKPKPCYYVLYRQKSLPLGNAFKRIFVKPLTFVDSQSLKCKIWVFCNLYDLLLNKLGCPLLGRKATILNVLTCEQSSGCTLNCWLFKFPRFMSSNNCFSKIISVVFSSQQHIPECHRPAKC